MPHRYFETNLNPNDKINFLTGQNAHHLANVMRVKKGEEIIVCDANGNDYFCTVNDVEKEKITVAINTCKKSVSEPSVSVMLYVGYPKQDKLELIIQKAVELGAIGITPFFSKNCVVTPKKEEQKNERYNKIAHEAAKQSGRGIIPKVYMPLNYTEMIKEASKSQLALYCYEASENTPPLHSRVENGVKTIAVITGSEGGFTTKEADFAQDENCAIIGLGPRILRCETAPIAVLSAIMTLTGNLQ